MYLKTNKKFMRMVKDTIKHFQEAIEHIKAMLLRDSKNFSYRLKILKSWFPNPVFTVVKRINEEVLIESTILRGT